MKSFSKNILVLAILLFSGCSVVQSNQNSSASIANNTTDQTAPTKINFIAPISNAKSRITKKTFGLKISPGHSPVSPEKFSGYHTGTDFETTADEQNIDVSITAVCAGKLLLKKYASGYGGVAVQSCIYNGQPITIIYGHLRFSSIKPNVGDTLKPGDFIAVLGTGYSAETDGERKHLHLGIHKGSSINILGYVQNLAELQNWYDPQDVISGLK